MPRVVVAFDTVSPAPGVAVLCDTPDAAASAAVTGGAETLPAVLEDVLRRAGVALREVDAVVVVSGPGSFTGLRAGTAFGRGLARGLGRRLRLVPTFTAASASRPGGEAIDFVLDAGRGDVHRARRRGSVLAEDPAPLPRAEALASAAGDGAALVDLDAARLPLAVAAAGLVLAGAVLEEGLRYGRPSAAEERLAKLAKLARPAAAPEEPGEKETP